MHSDEYKQSFFKYESLEYSTNINEFFITTHYIKKAWHRGFNNLMSCQHPSIWKFIEILKKEQGLTEIKHAFYISGRNPPKRKC